MINQAQLQFLCNAPHDGGFTHPRTGLHKRDQTSVQTFGYELPYLTWGATIQIGHLKLLAATRKKICSITLRDIFTYQSGKLFPKDRINVVTLEGTSSNNASPITIDNRSGSIKKFFNRDVFSVLAIGLNLVIEDSQISEYPTPCQSLWVSSHGS